MIRSVVATLLCCAIGTHLNGQSKTTKQKKQPKPVSVFSIGKQAVSAEEFIYLYRKNHQDKPEEFTSEKVNEYLDLFIKFKLKVEEARRRGYDTAASFIKEYNSYKDELRKPYLPDNRLSDSLTRLTYERMKEEVNASHLLINVKPDATPADTLKAYTRIMELRSKIIGGEDFAKLATQFSEDPSAKSNAGNLGYFSAMQMVYAFENAAFSTPIGSVSMPIRTRFGYHIVKVNDRRPSRGEVEVSHIMVRTGDGKDNDKSRNLIFEIYDQLRGGVSWNDLCKQYSEDPGSKDNNGRLRPFGPGAMASIPAFEQVAFTLKKPGDISDPFQTQFGWHIVKLENKIPLAPFEEMGAALKNRVNRDERTQISKQALQVKLRKSYALTENASTKATVMALADSSLIKGKWSSRPIPLEKEVLSMLRGEKLTVTDFFAYIKANQRPVAMAPAKYMDQLYNNFVDARILALTESDIVAKHPEYAFLLKEYYEGILLFDIMEKEVWNKASADSVGQLRFFKANAQKYQAGERVKAVLYSSASQADLDPLKTLLQKKDSVKTAEYLTLHKVRREAGAFEKDDKPVLSKTPWAPGIYSAENNGMYYLAEIFSILSPGLKSFEEARPLVISDYQDELEKQWLESLKKKYPVKVNEKGKQYILAQLKRH